MAQYEYRIITIGDLTGSGPRIKKARLDIDTATDELNRLGREGWHVVSSYSNPYMPTGGFYFSEHIMVLERQIN